MAEEYLVFNLVVIAGPVIAAQHAATTFRRRWLPALTAIVIVAVPFIVWDILVTGRHWSFNPAYYSVHLAGLPLGEWAFFLTVPLACLFTWEMVSGGVDPTPVRRPVVVWEATGILLVVAAAAWARGMEYTAVACAALAAALALDLTGGGRVSRHRRFAVFAVVVLGCTAVFNGYLTARPLVLYDPRYQLDVRLGTIPVEDFIYGLALVIANVTLFERLRDRMGAPRTPLGDSVFRRIIRTRLGGYRQQVNTPRAEDALRTCDPCRVAVVGGGLAGLRAATLLGDRGFTVGLFEKAHHLGGKVGAWPHHLNDGTTVEVEHGFHAFFRHYYNLRRFLDEVDATQHLRPIDDYLILTRGGEAFGFRDLETVPLLNILGMLGTPMLRLRDLLTRPRLARLIALLRYDPARTFARYDHMSFDDLADEADLPPALRVVFSSFARAFFATPDRMSAAEVIKSFHFFYLSHDRGLLYDCLADTYGRTLLAPMRARLEAVGGTVRLGTEIGAIASDGDRFRIDEEAFDYLVLAPDVVGARSIAAASPDLHRIAPRAMANLAALTPAQPYAVLRLWLDRPAGDGLPGFVIIAKDRLLDSVTFLHRVEAASAAWSATSGGSVLELHCYSVPDGFPETEIAATLKDELWGYFPELRGVRMLGEALQVKRNFTAFHVGMRSRRPRVETEHPRLVLAGDWVASDGPAMLMEAAVTSGLEAANAILRREGVREEPVYSVPWRGLFARRMRD
ncbi:MAG: lycopene cyclase domain-containing protein, partial [Candidatus Binatia bacterium]